MKQALKQLSPEIVRVSLDSTNGIIMNFKTKDVFRFVSFDWNDDRPDNYEFHHQRQFAGTVIHFCNARNHKIRREGLFPSQRENRRGAASSGPAPLSLSADQRASTSSLQV